MFSGIGVPVTCLAVSESKPRILYGGCWNKTIHSWNTESYAVNRIFGQHDDFVKAVKCVTLGDVHALISASADGAIIVWNANSGRKLHVLRGHTRGVTALAIDPSSGYPLVKERDEAILFSAGSDREIRRWLISPRRAIELITAQSGNPETNFSMESLSRRAEPIIQHETSIYAISFDGDGDLWTASADKSAKRLMRDEDWKADMEFRHPDFVRDAVDLDTIGWSRWVATACRDEEVRVWDLPVRLSQQRTILVVR